MTTKRAPRKQPTQKRSQALVAAVVAATEALATEIGVGAITMPLLAKRAGTALASVYEYFPSKDAVLAAWAESTWERALQAGFVALERAIVVERLPVELGMSQVVVAINRELRVFARACADVHLENMVGRSERRLEHTETIRTIIEGILAGASDLTRVRVRNPSIAARLLASFLVADSYIHFLAVVEDDAAADAEVTDMFRRYLRGDA